MRVAARSPFLPLAVLALGLGACDDPTELGEHVDAEGMALIVDGSEIYRYMLEDGLPPELTLAVGVHEVAVVLLDHDGEPIPHVHEEGEEEEELEVTITNAAVLTWNPEPDTGEEHEFLEFHGALEALQVGETSMSVCLLHEGHCDFEANNIPVAVTQ